VTRATNRPVVEEFRTPGLSVRYDTLRDELVVEGVRYSGELFRTLGLLGPSTPAMIQVIDRNEDGVVTLKRWSDLDEWPDPIKQAERELAIERFRGAVDARKKDISDAEKRAGAHYGAAMFALKALGKMLGLNVTIERKKT